MDPDFAYPLFAVIESAKVADDGRSAVFEGLVTLDLSDGRKALAIFTTQEGAEEFRAKHVPDRTLVPIRDDGVFAGVLVIARSVTDCVVFDPEIAGQGAHVVSYDQLLEPR